MQIIKLPKKSVYKELVCWFGLILYLAICNIVKGTLIAKISFVIIYILNFALAYYLLFLVVFPNFFENKKLVFISLYAAIIALFVVIDYVHATKILPFLGGHNNRSNLDFYHAVKRSLTSFCYVACSSLASYLNWRSVERLKESEEKEKNIISKELNYIKDQFNSHFTFNFFNFCYSKTLCASSKAAIPIAHFSEMLRFSLRTGSADYVPVKEESDYIENFILVQQCLTAKVFSQFYGDKKSSDYYIVPGILSVFVENAFKHGVFHEKKNPIVISLRIKNDTLTFTVKNKRANKKMIVSTGIGLNDLDQVLQLFYPGEHYLYVKQSETRYCSQLKLKLSAAL